MSDNSDIENTKAARLCVPRHDASKAQKSARQTSNPRGGHEKKKQQQKENFAG